MTQIQLILTVWFYSLCSQITFNLVYGKGIINNSTKVIFIGGIVLITAEILYITLYINEEWKRVLYLGKKKEGGS